MPPIEEKYSSAGPAHRTNQDGIITTMSFLVDGNKYVLDCLTSVQALVPIAAEWKHLEQNCGEPYIFFQSYDWCRQWCNTFAQTGEKVLRPRIKIYTLHRNGELVMVWPLMVVRICLGLNNLTFLTEPLGQYGNIICNRQLLPIKVGNSVWNYIRKNAATDTITLDQYPRSSFLKKIIDGNGMVEKSNKHTSFLDLTAFEAWEDYRASLSRKMRKIRNQRRKKLAKQGDLNYEIYYGGSKRYRELVSLALQWKTVWLQNTGRREMVLSQDNTRKFLSLLVGTEGKADTSPNGVVLGALTLNDEPISIEIGLCLDGHYYSYLGAFEWEHRNFSPGKVQIEAAQTWAKEVGLQKFDFLGDPAEYKTAWSNSKDALESRSVPLTMRGFFYCVFWKVYLKPTLRLIFNKMNAKYRAIFLGLFRIRKTGMKDSHYSTL